MESDIVDVVRLSLNAEGSINPSAFAREIERRHGIGGNKP